MAPCCHCHCSCQKTEVILKVNMCCNKCKEEMLKVFNEMKEVDSIDVDCDKQMVKIKGSLTQDECIKQLKKIGKEAEPWPKKDEGKEKDSGPETIVVYRYLERYPRPYYGDMCCLFSACTVS